MQRRTLWAAMAPLACLAGVFSGSLHASTLAPTPLISEVLYDAVGGDGGATFVELFGRPGFSLAGMTLVGVNGSDGNDYKSAALNGVIPADGVFVIGDDGGGGSTSVPDADLIADIDLQNGPDSLQLRSGATVLDAIGYGDFSAAVFAGEGRAAPDVSSGASLARLAGLPDTNDNLSDFQVLSVPTPGTVPVSSVPVPGAAWLFGSGLAVLSARSRRPRSDS
ncbi:MAG TPA: hypothetical protein VKA76_05520 [Gammaproteobacteria bacterium]|nr:hypothetical protein [Gammaproteobacteria bacterium]